jgi:hypothetical protein
MSADSARVQLEASLWRLSGATANTAVSLVDAALEAADAYAQAFGADFASAVLDGAIHDQRTAERRRVLADALRGT